MRLVYCFFVVIALWLGVGVDGNSQPGMLFPKGEAGVDFNKISTLGKREGLWIRQYKNKPSVLYYKGYYSNGIPSGIWEFYDQEGNVMSKVDHIQDTTINEVQFFYREGGLMAKGQFVGSQKEGKWSRVKNGTWTLFHPNQQISTVENYKMGIREGDVKIYSAQGVLVVDEHYVNGEKHGLCIEWTESGKKIKEQNFQFGTQNGDYVSYYESGSIREKGTYTNGRYDKVWRFYHDGGRDQVIIHYEMGEIVKKIYINMDVEEFYESGVPKVFCSYEKGKKQGPFKEYHDVGHFEVYEASEEDKKMGIMERERLVGTVVAIEGDYLDDHYEGEIIFRNKDGSVAKVETWEGGKLIKTTAKNN
jgi:antitoxin component YwqK of YwqJK toxin-antitoxin module